MSMSVSVSVVCVREREMLDNCVCYMYNCNGMYLAGELCPRT